MSITVSDFMMKFKDQISKKLEAIIEKYAGPENCKSSVEIPDKDQSLFQSMGRWHRNFHLSDGELFSLLENIKQINVLDVKEKMPVIPVTLQTFLNKQHRATSSQDSFSVNELFEVLLPSIKDLYMIKVDERDSNDEFGLDSMKDNYDIGKLAAGMQSEDLMFYERTFMPAALFFIYAEIHKELDVGEEELCKDMFSIGAGSKTYDLLPELAAACPLCITNICDGMFEPEEVHSLNKGVFMQQVRDNFSFENLTFGSESSANLRIQHEDDELSQSESICNPFSGVNKIFECGLPSDDESAVYECNLCLKEFTRNDFLQFHTEVFHGSKSAKEVRFSRVSNVSEAVVTQVVKPTFVDDEVPELMKTFVVPSPKIDILPVKKQTRSKVGVRKVLKYPK